MKKLILTGLSGMLLGMASRVWRSVLTPQSVAKPHPAQRKAKGQGISTVPAVPTSKAISAEHIVRAARSFLSIPRAMALVSLRWNHRIAQALPRGEIGSLQEERRRCDGRVAEPGRQHAGLSPILQDRAARAGWAAFNAIPSGPNYA